MSENYQIAEPQVFAKLVNDVSELPQFDSFSDVLLYNL